MSKDLVLKIEKLNKYYRMNSEELHILRDLELEVERGEFISIIGKSGSGKSTFLNMLGLLDKADSGEIYYGGEKSSDLKEGERDVFRNRKLGFVFQFHYLLPEFTALENVMIPSVLKDKDFKMAKEEAVEILAEMGLAERLNHKPSELSGGEKQRVAIARALINKPEIILADEPTGNLDDETSESVHAILKRINKERKQTVIVVTHSEELSKITEKRYLLKNGKLKEVF